MVVSFLNDSTVGVAPIYWIMMGMGLSVNGLIKNKRKQLALEADTESEGSVKAKKGKKKNGK